MTILICDDEKEICEQLGTVILNKYDDCDVYQATSSDDIRMIFANSTQHFDMVFMDIALQSYSLVPGGVTINAVYSVNSYTVTWNINGNKTTETYKYGAVIEVPEVTPEAGYSFTGWSADIPNNMPAKNQSFTAKFAPVTYYAAFVADGKAVQKVAYTVEDSSIAEPTVPAKTGYTGVWQNYTLKVGGVTVNAVYTPVQYSAKFVADGKTVETVKYTVESGYIAEPDVPAKAGYTGVWNEYELKTGGVTVNAVYTPIQYSAKFIADGVQVTSLKYTVETASVNAPAVPEKAGYTGKWQSYELVMGGVTVNAVYTPIEYSAKFVADGKTVEIVKYTVEDNSIGEPTVPAKAGYDGQWDLYSLDIGGITVNAVYSEVIYYAAFVADGKTIATIPYTVSTKTITEPTVPTKTGYTGQWSNYALAMGGITVEADYAPNTYTVKWIVDGKETSASYKFGQTIVNPVSPTKEGHTFKGWTPAVPELMPAANQEFYAVFEPKTFTADVVVDGRKIGEANYTYGDTTLDLSAYTVPEKAGYTGKWSSYTLDIGGTTVTAVYTPIVYKAVFKAEGVTVGTADYTVETAAIQAPAVPEKAGYTGKWESYSLAPGGITVNAVYTSVFKQSEICVSAEKTVEYRSLITIKATAKNVPDGYILAIYVNGAKVAEGTNTEVSYTYGELKSDLNYTVKVIDTNGKVQKDGNGNDLAKDGGKITCDAGFFQKLIAFFRGLFGSLPSVVVKP